LAKAVEDGDLLPDFGGEGFDFVDGAEGSLWFKGPMKIMRWSVLVR
jgi:hypothetical protein